MGDTAKQFSVQNFRPSGFDYPTGLNSTSAANTTIDYLVVAGGGGASGSGSGGGGAGGFLTGSNYTVNKGDSYAITVGAGSPSAFVSSATRGSFSLITNASNTTYHYAVGGGGGGKRENGGSGGSGGGAGAISAPFPAYTGGTGTPGQGNNGGTQPGAYSFLGGGGGGSGAPGGNATPSSGGNGGNGTASSISGSPVTYAGGGGGGGTAPSLSTVSSGSGGSGGGGNGATATPGGTGTDGSPNTGGGGGAGIAATVDGPGGAGGKGIVIIRYNDANGQKATGGTVTTPSGYVVHTFTGDGTFITRPDFDANYSVTATSTTSETVTFLEGVGVDFLVVAGGGGSTPQNSYASGRLS